MTGVQTCAPISAIYNPVSYSITYNLDGGSLGDKTNPSTYTIETDTFTIFNPKKSGYTFVGWEENGVIKPVITIEKGSIGTRTLKAIYEEIDLDFINQNIEKTYSLENQIDRIIPPSNGSGNYNYIISSEKDSHDNPTNHVTLDETTINIEGGTPVGGYSVIIKVTDIDTGAEKEVLYLIAINTKASEIVLNKNEVNVKHGENGTNTFTYDGDGEVVCESSSNKVTCTVDNENKTITVTGEEVGTYRITVKGINGTNYSDTEEKTFTVNIVDEDGPINTAISSTNNLDESQTVSLTCEDDVAVSAYYFGLDEPNENTDYITVRDVKVMNTANIISTEGKYYFACKDSSGNIGEVVEKSFYKTTLVVENGTVTPNKVLTMEGNKFNLPTPEANSGYEMEGHYYTNNSYTEGEITYNTEYIPNSSTSLYTYGIKNVYNVTYNYNYNGGTTVSERNKDTTVNTNVDLTITAEKEGYEFVGWNTDKDSHEVLEDLKMPSNDLTLYAIFRKELAATFNTNGATSQISSSGRISYDENLVESCYYYNNDEASCNITVPEIRTYPGAGLGYTASTSSDEIVVNEKQSLTLTESKTYYAKTGRAKFIDGESFKRKVYDRLIAAGGNDDNCRSGGIDEVNCNFYFSSFSYNENIPDEYKNSDYLVSTPDSEVPIYVWGSENGSYVMNWYSRDKNPYINENADLMFYFYTSRFSPIDFTFFNTSKMESAYYTFSMLEISGGTIDVSHFDTSRLSNAAGMFTSNSKLKTIYSINDFDISSITEGGSSFNSTGIIGGQGTTCSSLNCTIEYAKIDGGTSNPGLFTMKPQEDAIFDSGYLVNGKMKELAGTTIGINEINDNITNIEYSNTLPEKYRNNDHMVSDLRSETPIYMWFDNGTIYWYSSNPNPYLNENAAYMFSGLSALTTISDFDRFDGNKTIDATALFKNCSSLKNINIENFNIARITTMESLFENCSSLTNLDLSSWNIKNFFNTSKMFKNCSSLSSIKFGESKGYYYGFRVTNAEEMFAGCSSLVSLDLSKLDIDDLTNTNRMFADDINLKKIYVDDFRVNNIATSEDMFINCYKLEGDLGTSYDENHVDKEYAIVDKGSSNFGYFSSSNAAFDKGSNVNLKFKMLNSNAKHLVRADSIDTSIIDINNISDNNILSSRYSKGLILGWSNGDTIYYYSSAPKLYLDSDASNMFDGLSVEDIDLTGIDTSKTYDMSNLFHACISLKSLDLSNFDTSNVTNMSYMFAYTKLNDINLSSWQTGKVTDMSYMFAGISTLEDIDFSNFDFSKVKNISYMLSGVSNIDSIDFSTYSFPKLERMDGLFASSSFKTINISNMKPSLSTTNVFSDARQLTEVTLNNFKIRNGFTFSQAPGIKKINAKNLDVSGVTSLSGMFTGLTNLIEIDLSNINVSNITDMSNLFLGCISLETIDLSTWKTSSLTNISQMFTSMYSLKTIYVGDNFNNSNVVSTSVVFGSSSSLVGGNGTIYSNDHIDSEYFRIDSPDSPGYLTYKAPDTGASISKLIKNNSIKYGGLILVILIGILITIYLIYTMKKRK